MRKWDAAKDFETADCIGPHGLSRSTVYQRVTEGRFPRPVSLGARAVGWIEAEVDEWIACQIEASRELSVQISGVKRL
jgi:prophage regulatory protein